MNAISCADSPVHTPAWYAHAGWLPRVHQLCAGTASVAVWQPTRGEHHFHDVAAVLTEPGFIDGLGALVAAARSMPPLRIVSTISPYGYRGGIGPAEAADAHQLAADLVAHAKSVGADLVASYYLYEEHDAAWLAALREVGGYQVLMGADAVLDIVWDDLGDYYRWLGSGRRSLRHGTASRPDWPAPSNALNEPLHGPAAERVTALLLDGRRADPAPAPRTLVEAAVAGEEIPRTLLTLPEPEAGAGPRAAAVLLRASDGLWAKFFGSRRARIDYLPLAYTHVIDHAIRTGQPRVYYGGGAHQAKLFRGARLRPGWGVLVPLTDPATPIVELACAVGRRRQRHFGALARRWQLSALPLDQAFEENGHGGEELS